MVEEQLIIETEFTFWCSCEICAHNYLTADIGAEDGAGRGHEEIDVFDYVDEGFVFAVFDVAATPGLSAGSLHCYAGCVGWVGGCDGEDGGGDVVGSYVHLEDVDIGVLGVAEVEDFCDMLDRALKTLKNGYQPSSSS